MSEIDWARLAADGGWIVNEGGGITELVGAEVGRDVLVRLLDPSFIDSAISAALAGELGQEAARSVLILLRPRSAIDRCVEIVSSSTDPDLRMMAADLLGSLAADEKDALNISEKLLEHTDTAVAFGGLDLLEARAKVRRKELPQIRQLLERCADRPGADFRRRAALLHHALAQVQD